MSTFGTIQINQIISLVTALALLWLAVAVPVGMALLWRAHKRLVKQQTVAIVKAVRGNGNGSH